jgi:hypothetical protein
MITKKRGKEDKIIEKGEEEGNVLKKRLEAKEIWSIMIKCRRMDRKTRIKIRRKKIIKRMEVCGKGAWEMDHWLRYT